MRIELVVRGAEQRLRVAPLARASPVAERALPSKVLVEPLREEPLVRGGVGVAQARGLVRLPGADLKTGAVARAFGLRHDRVRWIGGEGSACGGGQHEQQGR